MGIAGVILGAASLFLPAAAAFFCVVAALFCSLIALRNRLRSLAIVGLLLCGLGAIGLLKKSNDRSPDFAGGELPLSALR